MLCPFAVFRMIQRKCPWGLTLCNAPLFSTVPQWKRLNSEQETLVVFVAVMLTVTGICSVVYYNYFSAKIE